MKKFTTGLLAGAVLTSSITTFAASGRMIEVFDNVKKVVVNKVEKPFDKNNKPFVYNGTTYVPLRFVADALGEAVDWDGKTGTVFIGETNNKNAHYWEQDIKHIGFERKGKHPSGMGAIVPRYRYSYNSGSSEKDNMGNLYTNYLVLSMNATSKEGYGILEFPLNGKYKTFSAVVAPTDNYLDETLALHLKIYLDGKEVSSMTVGSKDSLEEISLNLEGANRISFEISGASDAEGTHSYDIGIFNAEFIK